MAFASLVWLIGGCGPVYVQDRAPYSPPASQQPVAAAPVPVAASDSSGAQGQFGELGSYGRWVWTERWGEVWVPFVNASPYWRPYYLGRWIYTEYGWTWASDEPWGWAPYHYGRWTWSQRYHWMWIPGYVWGPAWVGWRVGGGCVGWSPLGPGGRPHHHYSYWIFVSKTDISSPHLNTVVIRSARVTKVYNQSQPTGVEVTIRDHDGETVVYNSGPSREAAQQWTRTRIAPRQASTVPGAVPRGTPPQRPTAGSGRLRGDAGGAARGSPRGPGASSTGSARGAGRPGAFSPRAGSGARASGGAGGDVRLQPSPRDSGPGSSAWRPKRPPYERPPTTRPGRKSEDTAGRGRYRPGSAAKPPPGYYERPPVSRPGRKSEDTAGRGRYRPGSAAKPPAGYRQGRQGNTRRPRSVPERQAPKTRRRSDARPKPYYGNSTPTAPRGSGASSRGRVESRKSRKKDKKRYKPNPPKDVRAPREVPKYLRSNHRAPAGRSNRGSR